jgi:hypothetical protein
MSEFTVQDRERLVRVETAVGGLADDLREFVDTARSDTGFPRCAARAVKWDDNDKQQKKVDNFITWFYRGIIGILVAAFVSSVWSHSTTIMKVLSSIGEGP